MSAFKRLREFVEGEDAKADDIETEFDNIYSTLHQGITTDNIADGGIATADIANGAVGATQIANGGVTAAKIAANNIGKSQLATGYTRRVSSGYATAGVGGGYAYSVPFLIPHGLGEVPSACSFSFRTAQNWVIALECRVLNLDATNIQAQVIQSSATPANVNYIIYWTAIGQP